MSKQTHTNVGLKVATRRKSLQIAGMTGPNDEHRIETALRILPGIKCITAHFPIDAVFVEYDPSLIDWDGFDRQLRRIGYNRIKTTTTVTISVPELVCPSIVNRIRSFCSVTPWIENVQLSRKPASVEIAFDSRAWTEQEILCMVSEQTHQQRSSPRC